jgi:hypothetical protein
VTSAAQGLLDRWIRSFDRRQRRRLGIWEFSSDPQCILRLGRTRARVGARLSDGTVVQPGETIGVIHFWNERIPPIPESGADLAWAREFSRLLDYSLHLLGQYLVEEQAMTDISAFGGELPLVYTPATLRFLRRVGFEVFDPIPPRGLVVRVVDLVSRIWVLLMRRAFNPASVRGVGLKELRRRPVWISRQALVARYGPAPAGSSDLLSGDAR